MSGADVYAKVKVTRKPGHQAAAKLCAGREDDITYATVKFAEAPSSQQQQQTDPSRTAGREDDVTYATVKFAEAPSSQQQQRQTPATQRVSP
ncbi:B-cell differentiation antigen CD72-like isoform X1 [Huso huso]|uniref:B-cell differentiation antigen CD72-like isoform X1 n=1 Tax=Huso huso TaxID=61971 RepID=A0ABR0Y0W8_HUSHU